MYDTDNYDDATIRNWLWTAIRFNNLQCVKILTKYYNMRRMYFIIYYVADEIDSNIIIYLMQLGYNLNINRAPHIVNQNETLFM